MTPSREDLLERLKAATGASDALDQQVGRAFGWHSIGAAPLTQWRRSDDLSWRGLPPFSSSLDAALALVERMLPGWVIEMCLDAKGGSAAIAPLWWNPRYDEDATDMKGAHETAPTLPLAVLIALLSALPADSLGQEETGK